MASRPIISWHTDGETMETVKDFIFLGSKITADSDCSHKIKRHLLLAIKSMTIKAMTNLDSVLKSRNTTLLTKVHWVKAMVSPVVMYGYESWTIKEGWALKNGCFWTVVLEKTLESPLDRKKINQSIPKEINPEYSLEGLMLKLQYLDHLIQSADLLGKTLMLGNTEGRRRGWQRMRWLDGTINSTHMNLSKVWEMVQDRETWCTVAHGVAKSWIWLSNWLQWTLNIMQITFILPKFNSQIHIISLANFSAKK